MKEKIKKYMVKNMSEMEVPKGLTGVIVDSTSIATTDPEGNLVYRGYRAVDLARHRSFAEIAYLVVYGELPDKHLLSEFEDKLFSYSKPIPELRRVIEILKEKNVMVSLRTLTSAIQVHSENALDTLLAIAAQIPVMASDSYRNANGLTYLNQNHNNLSKRMYYLFTGEENEIRAAMLEKIMIMYMEHEFNASTFALRVAASTATDPASAINAAISTLKGPLHGGANAEILSYLLKFKDEEEGISFVKERLDRKQLIMGFGHRVYKTKDPRAQFIKEELRKIIGSTERFKIATAIEDYLWDTKKLPANLDYYGAFYLHEIGIVEPLYTPLFASSRVFGWIAHYLEQTSNNKLIRPLAKYIGPTDRKL